MSLLKDCYIAWPRARVLGWVEAFRARLLRAGRRGRRERQRSSCAGSTSIGVQRHIKVLGIFCRLWYRDGKPGYLADLPRTLDYVREACARYARAGRASAASSSSAWWRRCRAPTRASPRRGSAAARA